MKSHNISPSRATQCKEIRYLFDSFMFFFLIGKGGRIYMKEETEEKRDSVSLFWVGTDGGGGMREREAGQQLSFFYV